MLENERIRYLFKRYLNNAISDSELDELFEYIKNTKDYKTLEEYLRTIQQKMETQGSEEPIDWDAMFDRILHRPQKPDEIPKMRLNRAHLWRNIAAVVALFVIGIGAYLYFHQPPVSQKLVQQEETKADIMPGGSKAVLTLGSGQHIILDSTNAGLLSMQGNTKVVQLKSGSVVYQKQQTRDNTAATASQHTNTKTQAYNTLTVPRGGKYQLILSDGTKVWLNAASSIRYPIAFTGNERKVSITGEVYFEVMHDEKHPFKVIANGEVIEDLGTHFNVNAYADEPAMKVTLLEGAVKVRDKILKPGGQALIQDGKVEISKDVNVSNVVAWKDGYFAFDNATLATVMRKLARWYDIEVVYKQGMENNKKSFSGTIGRDLTLSQVLTGLRQMNTHFTIEPDRRTVILQ